MQSLEEAKQVPAKAKARVPHQQSKLTSDQVHTGFSSDSSDKLDIEVLKEELTRKNYVKKFRHLLLWEEQEHDRILKEKYVVI